MSFSDPDCYLVPDNFFTLKFRADADTDSTLESTDGESLFLSDDAGGNLTDIGGTEPTPINKKVSRGQAQLLIVRYQSHQALPRLLYLLFFQIWLVVFL
ncbi:MAG: hypothetical protein ACRBHB_09190 [Arenicella sp.]